MCSAGGSFGVELEGGMEPHENGRNHCGKKFKGIGTNSRCPKCQSRDNKCIEYL
jgi:predicted Zn-ribbon and HTH transcriptional regulator